MHEQIEVITFLSACQRLRHYVSLIIRSARGNSHQPATHITLTRCCHCGCNHTARLLDASQHWASWLKTETNKNRDCGISSRTELMWQQRHHNNIRNDKTAVTLHHTHVSITTYLVLQHTEQYSYSTMTGHLQCLVSHLTSLQQEPSSMSLQHLLDLHLPFYHYHHTVLYCVSKNAYNFIFEYLSQKSTNFNIFGK